MKIKSVHALQVLDSRGFPTVQCGLATREGIFSAMVPSGASTGSHEAHELRDNAKEWMGKGVLKAVSNVNTAIAKKISGKNFASQKELDDSLICLDGTENKEKLGANAILSVSMAFTRAIAAEQGTELFECIGKISGNKKFALPVPMVNVINGGKHAGKENDIQEHMFIPLKFNSFSGALQASVESYHCLKSLMKGKFGAAGTHLADEGGFAPGLAFGERLVMMEKAIEDAGYSGRVFLGLDCAASEFFNGKKYQVESAQFSSGELIDFYSDLASRHRIISIEDGLAEDDWKGWMGLTSRLGAKVQIVGDDLLVTNPNRIKEAIGMEACNALLLKLNQIGTVSESIEAAKLASKAGWKVVVSHRSGETEDSFIADFCVGIGAGQSKFGATARGERTAKYNRLLAIEEALGKKALFAGESQFKK
ncbi:Enolase [uncultured archaeon]|nr:Enolase [uncultured archaeon]